MTTVAPCADLVALRERVGKKMREFPDFPKPGILFRDIMPLFHDMQLVDDLCSAIAVNAKCIAGGKSIDAVLGLEARGFLFAPIVASKLHIPFVPIRKKGKLPGAVISATYTKEYGQDVIEMQADAIKPNSHVLLIDDLLATGGTLDGAISLLHKMKVTNVQVFCLIELIGCHGRRSLPPNVQVTTLLSYD